MWLQGISGGGIEGLVYGPDGIIPKSADDKRSNPREQSPSLDARSAQETAGNFSVT